MYWQPRILCKRFWSDLRRRDLAMRPIATDRCVARTRCLEARLSRSTNFTCRDLTRRTASLNFIYCSPREFARICLARRKEIISTKGISCWDFWSLLGEINIIFPKYVESGFERCKRCRYKKACQSSLKYKGRVSLKTRNIVFVRGGRNGEIIARVEDIAIQPYLLP